MQKRMKDCIIISIAIIVFILFTYWKYSYLHINSDYANLVLEARDLINGDFFRRDWNLTGISFLATDLIYFCFGVMFFGISEQAYIVACTLMQTLLVVTSLILCKDRINTKNKIVKWILFIALTMFPGQFALDVLRAHTGVFIVCFFALFLFNIYMNKEKIMHPIVLEVVIILTIATAIMSDPIILILITLPIYIWCIVVWVQRKCCDKLIIKLLSMNTLSVILGYLMDKLYFIIGGANKNAFLGSKSFVNLNDIPDKIVIYFRSLLYLVDAHFEESPLITFRTLFYAVNTVALIVFFIIVLYNIVSFLFGHKYDFITVILGIGFFILSLLFILSTIATDIAGARYMGFFTAFMAIIYVRNIDLILNKADRLFWIVLISSIILLTGKMYNIKFDTHQSYEGQAKLINFLDEKGLHNGYASFWNASSTTVLSKEKVKIRAITSNGINFQKYNWFCKNEWYKEISNFIIAEKNDLFGVTPENVIIWLGIPDSMYEIDGYQIMIYNEDISKRLINGLEDGILSISEWNRNDLVTQTSDSLILKTGGMLYGPYSRIEQGVYTGLIKGDNLNFAEFDIFSNTLGVLKERSSINTTTEYTFDFYVPKIINDIEIRIYNDSSTNISIYSMTLQ